MINTDPIQNTFTKAVDFFKSKNPDAHIHCVRVDEAEQEFSMVVALVTIEFSYTKQSAEVYVQSTAYLNGSPVLGHII